jgi:hypothetical protein
MAVLDRSGLPRAFHRPLRQALPAEILKMGADVQADTPGSVAALDAPPNS